MDSDAREHEEFVGRLVGSHASVLWVKALYERAGYKVRVLPYTVAPTHEEWRDHVDEGDLMVRRPSWPAGFERLV